MMDSRFTVLVRAVGLLLAAGLSSMGACGAAEPGADDDLKVITYNVQFLPGPAAIANKRKEPQYRAEQIGQKLAGFDIVALNEVFEEKPREKLLDQLRAAWGAKFSAVISPKPDDKRFMGGVAIATQLPVLATHTLMYSVGSSPEKYGLSADGFAAKGALHMRIARGASNKDHFVDVFATHLESKDDEIRAIQYKELAAFVAEHGDLHHPALIVGDMNTRGDPEYQADNSSAYNTMLDLYRAARPGSALMDVWPVLHHDRLGGTNEQESSDIGHRIDYILLANPAIGRGLLRPIAVQVNGYLDPRVGALSDHSAVEAVLRWQ